MRRMILLVCVAVLTLAMTAGTAVAAPTQAENYWEFDATCEELGEITAMVTNLGTWGAAKVQGTQITLIPRWFTFDVSVGGEVVFSEEHVKSVNVDDICRYSWEETIETIDGATTYLFEGAVGVKVVGRR